MKSQIDIFDEIIVDNFAGGGGASTGIELAAGRPVTIAINHDPQAILLHRTNHPYTEHYTESVWNVDPKEICKGRPVGLAWFSPDCKHFSKAKGAALVDRNIRGLAWIVLRWAGTVRPRVIMLENVEEFQTWGPVRKGKPVKKKAGQTFRKWKQQLEDLGYVIEHRELVAADYGAPTTRKRFVLVARCDGKPIVWPERTHAPRDSEEVKSGKCLPWRGAHEIIDWSQPCYSIFASKEEVKEKYGADVRRPLKPNTIRRVIRGVDKFTIKSGKPFIVQQKFNNAAQDIMRPLTTVTTVGAHELVQPVVAPFVAECNHGGDGHLHDINEPLNTITQKYTGGIAQPLMTPFTFSNTGESVGSCAADPVHTIRTGGGGQVLSAANLIQYHTEQSEKVRGQGMEDPIMTLDASNRYGLATAQLIEYYGNGNPLDVTQPMHTATTHDREALVCAHLDKYFSGGYKGCGDSCFEPLSTLTVEPRHGLCSAHIQKFYGGVIGEDAREPMPTITQVDHNAVCSAHMVKFKGQELGTSPAEPLPTLMAQSSSGGFAECRAVLVKAGNRDLGYWPQIRALLNEHCGYNMADDEVILLIINGIAYFIADILLRMLNPREQYDAMSFPPDYAIEYDYLGNKYKKSEQTAKCGNAVCPALSYAVVWANFPEWHGARKLTTMAELDAAVAV